MLADVDHIDVIVRQESLTSVPGHPVLVQLPIQPAYALTVHKTQALSISHTVRGCLEGVFAQGQIYVLVSRVTDPRNFELLGVPPVDLREAVAEGWRLAGLDIEECFRRALSITDEWELNPDARENVRDRVRPRRRQEQTIPLRDRTLAEILDPQPQASCVMHRLLDWIDRVDLMSQHGSPRPPFETIEGGPIFPNTNDPWWLTEVQKRKDGDGEVQGKCLEDGPASDVESIRDEQEVTDDDDPPSEESDASDGRTDGRADACHGQVPAPASPAAVALHTPRIAWSSAAKAPREQPQASRSARDPQPGVAESKRRRTGCASVPGDPGCLRYEGFFERQVEAMCGMHALNNAVGRRWQTAEDMEVACEEFLRERRFDFGMVEGLMTAEDKKLEALELSRHARQDGWYSDEIIAKAVVTTSMRREGRVEFDMRIQPLSTRPHMLHAARGAVVNIEGRHWVALRSVAGQVWLLDSLLSEPQPLQDYEAFVRKHKHAYPIFDAEQMPAAPPGAAT
jgi:hypothetical protein